MKTLIIATMLALCLVACKAPQYSIGMSQEEFLRRNKVEAVQESESYSVYKKVNYPFGAPPVIKFFYFRNGKLVQVDNGRQPDVIIDKTVHSH